MATSAFDDHRPPERDLIDDCVHCGFCLPTCPTYALWGEEMDSPRGRIYLMQPRPRGGRDRARRPDAPTHIDRCLGCMACVTACPSGVQYDRLIERARAAGRAQRRARRARERLFRDAIFALFPHPRRLRAARARRSRRCARRGSDARRGCRRLARWSRCAAGAAARGVRRALPERHARRRRAARRGSRCCTGCVQRVFFGDVNAATVRVLAAEGCDVHRAARPALLRRAAAARRPRGRRAGAGARDDDRGLRAGVDHVVVNVAGCGSSMKEYGHLLADDPA